MRRCNDHQRVPVSVSKPMQLHYSPLSAKSRRMPRSRAVFSPYRSTSPPYKIVFQSYAVSKVVMNCTTMVFGSQMQPSSQLLYIAIDTSPTDSCLTRPSTVSAAN